MTGLGERLGGVERAIARLDAMVQRIVGSPDDDVVRFAFAVAGHQGLLMTDRDGVVRGVADELPKVLIEQRPRRWSQTIRVRLDGIGLDEFSVTSALPRPERFATVENAQGVTIAGLHEPPRQRGSELPLAALLGDGSLIESDHWMSTQWLPWPRLHFDQQWHHQSATIGWSVTVSRGRFSDPSALWGVRLAGRAQTLERVVVLAMLTCGQRIDWSAE